MMVTAYDPLIQECATWYKLPFALLQAQVLEESSANPWAFRYEPSFFDHYILNKSATSKAYAYGPLAACSYGLLQILLETAYEFGFDDRPEVLFIPRVGLTFGAKYLRKLWDDLGGTDATYGLALQHYNGQGPGAVAYAAAIYQKAGVVA